MAELRTIAKVKADTIREGIAWVIIWKTDRSWNSESVWLNPNDDTFEKHDLDMVREILEADPNAIIVNGYYCGHFGENMTAAEIEAWIRWHYENGCNRLKDSTAFPPEPQERPDNLPADLAWCSRPTGTEPNPYIRYGFMSAEDFELMHKNKEAAEQQEEKPPDRKTNNIGGEP